MDNFICLECTRFGNCDEVCCDCNCYEKRDLKDRENSEKNSK